MHKCSRCGSVFDLGAVKRRIGRLYGAGSYDEYYSDGDVCDSCAIEEISADFGSGEDLIEDMGSGWDE